MGRSRGKLSAVGGLLGLVAALVPWTSASAAHVARIDVRPVQVAPGGEVNLVGPPGWAPVPVSIRWNAVDGEVLGTFQTTPGANASWAGTVKVPNVAPGIYELVGTQDVPANQTAVRGVPARARIQLVAGGATGGTLPDQAGTPAINALDALEEGGGNSVPAIALVGFGVFAATLAFGLLVGSSLRNGPATEPAAKART